jgi:hypothetical protein
LGGKEKTQEFAAWCRHELHRNQRPWVRSPPVAQATVAQWQTIGQSRAEYSRRKSRRDGAAQGYFSTRSGASPAALLDYSSRLEVGRREPRTSRRFAPGPGKQLLGLPGEAHPILAARFFDLGYRTMVEREKEWKIGCNQRHEHQGVYRRDRRGPRSGGPRRAAGIVERDRCSLPAFRAVRAAMGALRVASRPPASARGTRHRFRVAERIGDLGRGQSHRQTSVDKA